MDKGKERQCHLFSINDSVKFMGRWSNRCDYNLRSLLPWLQKTAIVIIMEAQPHDFIASLDVAFSFTLKSFYITELQPIDLFSPYGSITQKRHTCAHTHTHTHRVLCMPVLEKTSSWCMYAMDIVHYRSL